jgi:Eukaryotic cytochrome b561
MIAAFVVIEYNKFAHGAVHFNSIHGKLGLITYVLLFIQAFVGFTQYFVPQFYCGLDDVKFLYKWHRMSGYVILVMILATVSAATQTYTGMYTLDIKLWAVLVSSILILLGVIPRIKKQKFGLVPKQSGDFGQ